MTLCAALAALLPVLPALLLVLPALLPVLPARAGSYVWDDGATHSPTYTGGSFDSSGGPHPYVNAHGGDYALNAGGAYGWTDVAYGMGPDDAHVSCTGAVTAHFTWRPDGPGDGPPGAVVVREDSAAHFGTFGPATGSCDDGLGRESSTASGAGGYCSGTRYSVRGGPGASFDVTCSPSASAGGDASPYGVYGSAGVSYQASAYPVILNLSGTTKDSGGADNILVGQHCTASLVGIPSDCPVSYQWSIGGTTFQMWSPTTPAVGNNPANPNASYYVDGPGDLTLAQPGWYWNDLGEPNTLETVGCTATVQGSPVTLTATKQVTVWRPGWGASGTGGYVKINLYTLGDVNPEIFAAPLDWPSETEGGVTFNATVASPAPALFGDGSLELGQLVIPDATYVDINGTTVYCQDYGAEGLDETYPYGWNRGAPAYKTRDIPGFGLRLYMAAVTLKHQFEDFLMYTPPGSGQAVPLARFVWSINGSAIRPATGYWSDYASDDGSDAAGTVTPGGTDNFLRANSFPEWTQLSRPGFPNVGGH